jgi:hypothetical protein
VPKIACAAVASRHTRIWGCSKFNSASNHGWHALISVAFGFLCNLRLPRSSNLKCFTAFVTKTPTINFSVRQTAIDQLARWAHKRAPFAVLFISGLRAYKHNLR